MNKEVHINIKARAKFIAWVSSNKLIYIIGVDSKTFAQEWIEDIMLKFNFKCSYGLYNGFDYEIINRILKAEEIL